MQIQQAKKNHGRILLFLTVGSSKIKSSGSCNNATANEALYHSALKFEKLCKNNKNICTEIAIIQDHFKKDKNDLISLFLFPTSQLLFEAGPELLTKIKKVDFTQFTQIYSNVFKFTQFTQYCTFSGFFFFALFFGF